MNLLESILYGLVSGLAEFLPISARAHQAILMQLFGVAQRDPLRDLLVHIAVLLSLFIGCRSLLSKISREQRLSTQLRRNRRRSFTPKSALDLRFVKTAAVPMLIVQLLYLSTSAMESKPIFVSLFLILNGIILIVPEYMSHGNKDARSMTGLDGIILGIISGISALPGISRIGAGISYVTARGADRQHSIQWALLLSIPALILFCIFDVWGLMAAGIQTISFGIVLGYILSAAAAFTGGYLSILLVRLLSERNGFSGAAYYCWGAALFHFIIYLIA